MAKRRLGAIGIAALLFSGMMLAPCPKAQGQTPEKDFNQAFSLYERGMYGEAKVLFDKIKDDQAKDTDRRINTLAEGYGVLCATSMKTPGYETLIENYLERNSHAGLTAPIRYQWALNLFDAGEYERALDQFKLFSIDDLEKEDRTEYAFKDAYCRFSLDDYDGALRGFARVVRMTPSDFTAPSQYASGYINYERENFKEALGWFEESVSDPRFEEVSNYYITECHFMMKDYDYVTKHGPEVFSKVPEERKNHLARLISESFLVKGDADSAREYYDLIKDDSSKSRGDYYYAGSLLYAVNDWQGALDNYEKMGQKTDSIGQVALYQSGYAYIQTKNKVSAMDAFKEAASLDYDKDIQEDAFFNWAKLSFDLNNDGSVFEQYMKDYSDKTKGESIYAYMALAALYNHDYAGAVAAYDNIDELDEDMRGNYMKANYLRANQLIRNGSYRAAIPNLKAASFYADRRTPFYQLTRYWLGESYYRDDMYSEGREVFSDLYNQSALRGRSEGELVPFNLGYCYFMERNYDQAIKWFSQYVESNPKIDKKDAMTRIGDAYFLKRDFQNAADAYGEVLEQFPGYSDLYPNYQRGMAYGLIAANLGNRTTRARNEAKKNLDAKIAALSAVNKAPASANYYNETLYELGHAYMEEKQNDNARQCFQKLVDSAKDSTAQARGLIGLGMLSRNSNKYDEALSYYKRVVAQMPNSGYSEDALLAIESIYQAKKEPEKYLEYLQSIGASSVRNVSDQEQMLFSSAEQIFLSGNYGKALVSLQSYEENFPKGSDIGKVHFYIAECYRNLDKKDQACDYYKMVFENREGTFAESSAVTYADISYSLENYADAFEGYKALASIAKIPDNVQVAKIGMMRSAFKGRNYSQAISSADEVLLIDDKASADIKREADYIKAKSYLATSDRDNAFSILRKLARQTSTAEGAEAAYMLIQESYDKGEWKSVEEQVYALSDSRTSQTYWLAKSFIVLGDSFVEQEDYRQARATFESVRDGYTPRDADDDVPEAVKMRLDKLTELGK